MDEFKELTVGYNASGAEQYVADINAIIIDKTKQLADDTGEMFAILEDGWKGQGVVDFKKRLEKDIEVLKDHLDDERKNLEKKLDQMAEAMYDRDRTIVDDVFGMGV